MSSFADYMKNAPDTTAPVMAKKSRAKVVGKPKDPAEIPSEFIPPLVKDRMTIAKYNKRAIALDDIYDRYKSLGVSDSFFLRMLSTAPLRKMHLGLSNANTILLLKNSDLSETHIGIIKTLSNNKVLHREQLGPCFCKYWTENKDKVYDRRKVRLEALTLSRMLHKLLRWKIECLERLEKLFVPLNSIHDAFTTHKDTLSSMSEFSIHHDNNYVTVTCRMAPWLWKSRRGGPPRVVSPGLFTLVLAIQPQKNRALGFVEHSIHRCARSHDFRVNPHVGGGDGGSMCLGDGQYAIMDAINKLDFVTYFHVIQEYWTSVDTGDVWGHHITSFPELLTYKNSQYLPHLNHPFSGEEMKKLNISNLRDIRHEARLMGGQIVSRLTHVYSCVNSSPLQVERAVQIPFYANIHRLRRSEEYRGQIAEYFYDREEFEEWFLEAKKEDNRRASDKDGNTIVPEPAPPPPAAPRPRHVWVDEAS